MPPLVGDLVDPDAPQPVEAVNGGVDVCVDPGHDRANRAPRHPQQRHHRTLRGPDRQPRGHVIEVTGVTGIVPSPRHHRHRHAVRSAANTWRGGFQEYLRGAHIQGAPPAPALTAVIARRASTATTAPASCLRDRPHRHHDRLRELVEFDTLHDRARQPARVLPYALVPHPALPPWIEAVRQLRT